MSTSKKRDRWESDDDEEDLVNKDDRMEITTATTATETTKNVQKPDSVNLTSSSSSSSMLIQKSESMKNVSSKDNLSLIRERIDLSLSNEAGTRSSISLNNNHNPLLNGCRSVYNSYERLHKIDEGTYGIVWKARDLATNEVVALKQIKYDRNLFKEGFPITALREISVLLALNHESIVTVREMVVGDAFEKVFMVMELLEMDLQEAMKRYGPNPFPQSELKSILYQIISATEHIHNNFYLHRDLKTSNILVKSGGKVALCDFGLARKYQIPYKALTQMVITLWYRPPELLFGQTVYGPEVDMWRLYLW